MVFDDDGFKDDDSDIGEEELIKRIASQPKVELTPSKISKKITDQNYLLPTPTQIKLTDNDAIFMSAKSMSLTSSQKPQITFLTHKAGMDNCDMDAIRKKIYELEKDTDFYKK